MSKTTHAQKVWRRLTNYQFAAEQALAPIVLAEVLHVGSWMPILFVERAGRYVLIGHDVSRFPNRTCSSGRTANGWEVTCRPR